MSFDLQAVVDRAYDNGAYADDLDYERVLEVAKPYLGGYYSKAVDWTPLDNRAETNLFGRFAQPEIRTNDSDETWQFTSFLV